MASGGEFAVEVYLGQVIRVFMANNLLDWSGNNLTARVHFWILWHGCNYYAGLECANK